MKSIKFKLHYLVITTSYKTLPTMYYKSSRKEWQSQGLFKQKFFDCFVPDVSNNLAFKNLVQKSILLLDNATCHGSENILRTGDRNFTVHYFSLRTTAILQPLDQIFETKVQTETSVRIVIYGGK